MGAIVPHPRVKLICGLMWPSTGTVDHALVEDEWGPIDLASDVFDFDHTRYYEDEFGVTLKKQYVAFERLVDPDDLPAIKHRSNAMEDSLLAGEKRTVNIDPGYLADAKLVMITTKNLAHRVYIGRNMYADLQLMFRRHTFEPTPWTFADVRDPRILPFFNRARTRYMEQLSAVHEIHS